MLDDRDLAAERARAQASVTAAQSGAASAEAERESAEARVVLARATQKRMEQLREKNSATPQELDRTTAELQMAEAGARAAGARLAEASASVSAAQAAGRAAEVAASFSSIAAPFDGLVTNRLLEPGNMASPGVPILTIETTDGFRLEVQIDAARARSVKIGDTAAIELEDHGDCGHDRWPRRGGRPRDRSGSPRVRRQGSAARRRRRAIGHVCPRALRERDAQGARRAGIGDRAPRSTVARLRRRHRPPRAHACDYRWCADAVIRSRCSPAFNPARAVIVNPPASLVDGAEVRVTGERP